MRRQEDIVLDTYDGILIVFSGISSIACISHQGFILQNVWAIVVGLWVPLIAKHTLTRYYQWALIPIAFMVLISLGRGLAITVSCMCALYYSSSIPKTFWGKLVYVLTFILAFGTSIQFLFEIRDDVNYPAPGKLYPMAIDSELSMMHMRCVGRGNKTVLLDAGIPYNHLVFNQVLDERQLDERFTICAYDRMGYGWSTPSPNPRDRYHLQS